MAKSSEDIAIELREATEEARNVLRDIHAAVKDTVNLNKEITNLQEEIRGMVERITEEKIAEEVTTQLDALGKATDRAMRDSVERVGKSFEKLEKAFTGKDRHSLARGNVSLDELTRASILLSEAFSKKRKR